MNNRCSKCDKRSKRSMKKTRKSLSEDRNRSRKNSDHPKNRPSSGRNSKHYHEIFSDDDSYDSDPINNSTSSSTPPINHRHQKNKRKRVKTKQRYNLGRGYNSDIEIKINDNTHPRTPVCSPCQLDRATSLNTVLHTCDRNSALFNHCSPGCTICSNHNICAVCSNANLHLCSHTNLDNHTGLLCSTASLPHQTMSPKTNNCCCKTKTGGKIRVRSVSFEDIENTLDWDPTGDPHKQSCSTRTSDVKSSCQQICDKCLRNICGDCSSITCIQCQVKTCENCSVRKCEGCSVNLSDLCDICSKDRCPSCSKTCNDCSHQCQKCQTNNHNCKVVIKDVFEKSVGTEESTPSPKSILSTPSGLKSPDRSRPR